MTTTVTLVKRRLPWMLAVSLIAVVLVSILVWHLGSYAPSQDAAFDGERAFHHVITQMEFGPRITGTEGNRKAGDYIAEQLKQTGWALEFQEFRYMNTPIRNIVGRANLGKRARNHRGCTL